MTDRFKDVFVSRAFRFSLGIDRETGGCYISTPVSGPNRAVEWEAYFAIDSEQFSRFQVDPSAAEGLLESCRMGRNNRLLIYPTAASGQ